MDFSLSSSLVGNAVSNPDKLALDLQFATDKTLTARKGPTPVFTRASSATRINEAGLIETAPENMYSYSQAFNEVFWGKTRTSISANVATAPDGTLTADKLVEDTSVTNTHTINSSVTPLTTPHTFSVFAKKGERNFIVLRFGGQNDFFNLNTGVAITNLNSPTITNFGDGWYRCTVTSSGGSQGSIQMSADGITTSYTGDGTSGIFLWGAQLEASPTARTYIPTTTAAVYGARFDHDPITLACKGLLIEESRTNLTARSEGLDATPWAVQNATTITSNNTASPDGNVTAELFTVGATSTVYGIQNSSVSWTSGTTYTVSCFFKAREITRVNITVNNTGVLPINATFDLTGSGSIVGTPTGTAVIQRYGNGWYRCSVSATALSTALTAFRFSAVLGTSTTYPGNSVDSFYAWGAQVEAGAFPTSYIPTTTASVVRSADICSITSISSFYTGVGTILVGSQLSVISILNGVCGFFSGVNQITIGRGGSVVRASTNGNAPNLTINSGTLASTSFVKSAFAFNVNDAAFANNGTLSGTSTSVGIPSVTTFGIGTNGSQPTQSGTISEIKVFKKRLANAKLQSLTT